MPVEPVFTADWSGARNYWLDMFNTRGMVGAPNLQFLEVGCYEGRATLWLLENVLTHESSGITVVDTFGAFDGNNADLHSRELFDRNTAKYQEEHKLDVCVGDSKDVLRESLWTAPFDFIYIDGSHKAPDVLSDAVLAWPLLKSGGILAFDDYGWGPTHAEWDRPKMAIDAFISCYARQLRVKHSDYQVAVEKV